MQQMDDATHSPKEGKREERGSFFKEEPKNF
jgi:hypothetical protein